MVARVILYHSFRLMTSINLPYVIAGSITKCRNDRLGLRLVHLLIFDVFSVSFYVFIKIHDMINFV